MLDDHAVDSDSPRLSKTVMGMALGAGRDEMAAERHVGQEAPRPTERGAAPSQSAALARRERRARDAVAPRSRRCPAALRSAPPPYPRERGAPR